MRRFSACFCIFFLVVATIGCSIVLKKGDQVSVDNWKAVQERYIGDWALATGLSVEELNALTEEDFPLVISEDYTLDWLTWSTSLAGYATFLRYEEAKVAADEERKQP